MNTARTPAQWQEFVSDCADFRPQDGVRVARDMFTEPQLFDLEMEHIFEKNWIYACHESEIAKSGDFITMRAGRQPMIITRDANNELNALVSLPAPRRHPHPPRQGPPVHLHLLVPRLDFPRRRQAVEGQGRRPVRDDFDLSSRNLKKARIASYKGFGVHQSRHHRHRIAGGFRR